MPPLCYFVRHGQTAWNAEYRLQGQAETELTPLGRRQATGNGERLAELIADPARFDFVASPLKRTRDSMELARAAMGLDPLAYRTDARLMELNFGEWQGHTFAELEALSPGTTARRFIEKWDFLPPGAKAESYEDLARRVQPFLDELTRETVCVTHGGVVRTLFRLIVGMPKNEAAMLDVPQDTILRYQDGRLEWL